MTRRHDGRSGMRRARSKAAKHGGKPPSIALDGAEAENVKYFLRALDQISLALHALGYTAQGQTLAQVKFDLHQRIFSSSEKPSEILKSVH